MYGFLNHNSSCYLDVVLVALFAPQYNGLFDRLLLHQLPPVLERPDGREAGWERELQPGWRSQVQSEMLKLVTLLRSGECHGTTVASMRALLSSGAVPHASQNFGGSDEQSAVDFLRYLLSIFRVRDTLVELQQSHTFFTPRVPVTHAGRSVMKLVQQWTRAPITHKWTRANASTCPDADTRVQLMRDASGKTTVLQNAEGDVRHIGPRERASIFLCQLTAADESDSCHAVRIDRDVAPHAQVLAEEIEGYSGAFATKLVATRLTDAPVLMFEVARRAVAVQGSCMVERKMETPVYYGDASGQLVVTDKVFHLAAVICHLGNASSGHYIAYVRVQPDTWCMYDDASANGALTPVTTIEPLASRSGELFFYTLTSDETALS
jgi:hypothetical protein